MAKSKEQRIRDLAERIAKQVEARAGKGLTQCAVFLSSRVRETLSEPAKRKKVISRTGDIYYRAASPAIYGAPPRKLTGRLRASVTWQMDGTKRALVGVRARSEKGFNFPKHLEYHTSHKFLAVTALKYKKELDTIMGQALKLG